MRLAVVVVRVRSDGDLIPTISTNPIRRQIKADRYTDARSVAMFCVVSGGPTISSFLMPTSQADMIMPVISRELRRITRVLDPPGSPARPSDPPSGKKTPARPLMVSRFCTNARCVPSPQPNKYRTLSKATNRDRSVSGPGTVKARTCHVTCCEIGAGGMADDAVGVVVKPRRGRKRAAEPKRGKRARRERMMEVYGAARVVVICCRRAGLDIVNDTIEIYDTSASQSTGFSRRYSDQILARI